MPSRTLICVLDWGLGHAARSLALLDHPRLRGDEVFFAASGPAKEFLEKERPDISVFELPPYLVGYPTRSMPLNVALQLPKWWLTSRREQKATRRLVEELNIDRIISDNRFGCYAPGVTSIFLTHQLHPITNFAPVSWLYRHYLRRFDSYWVPDSSDRALSGSLSDPRGYTNVNYIGPLSRLRKLPESAKEFASLTLLSGPEPMRSRLERQLVQLLKELPGSHCLVRGTMNGPAVTALANTQVVDFATAQQLSELLPKARSIICRSGYSTLMDLAASGTDAKLILIPTPGQTEQEYLALAQVRMGRGNTMIRQRDLSHSILSKAISGALR